jgi:tetratricopeptide (TPR) repeat protein
VRACGNDGRLLRTRALAVLQRMLERMAAQEGSAGVVLLLDDLQWSDDPSLDALQSLMSDLAAAVLVVASARPALLLRRPAWGDELPQHVKLMLTPLNIAQRQEMTQLLLRRLAEPSPLLADLIERRAEGNPYHAEELLRMLLDQGVIQSADGDWVFHVKRLQPERLPTTLTGVLQSRLDALPGAERRSLQLASVIGPVFWDAALGALSPQAPSALPALQSKAMIFERPTSAFEDCAERAFQHHLLHQVTYETLLKSERQIAHAQAAVWLTQRVGGRSEEYLAITAQHYERAGERALAAEWFERASDRARQRFATQLALDYLDRADGLRGADATPQLRVASLRRRAVLCDSLGLFTSLCEVLDELLALAQEQGDEPTVCFVLTHRSLVNDRLGRHDEAEADARAGIEVAERIDDAVRAALCHGNLAWRATNRDHREAAAHLGRAMHWAALARERLLDPSDVIYEVQLLLVASNLHNRNNDQNARGAALMQAAERAAAIGSPRLRCNCLENLARWALDRGQLEFAAMQLQTLRRLALEFDLRMNLVQAAYLDALHELILGRHDRALASATESLRLARAIGAASNELWALDLQGEASARAGLWPAAAACFEELEQRRAQLADEPGAVAARLRLEAARWHCGGSAADASLQGLLEALRKLPDLQTMRSPVFGVSALAAAYSVLLGTGHADAAQVLALAVRAVEVDLSGHADPALQQHMRQTLPWMRNVLEAQRAASSDTAAVAAAGPAASGRSAEAGGARLP